MNLPASMRARRQKAKAFFHVLVRGLPIDVPEMKGGSSHLNNPIWGKKSLTGCSAAKVFIQILSG